MKSVNIFVIVLLFMGLFSLSAQDLIFMRDGNIIEAKVVEISPTEIRYRRYNHLDGPVIVILTDSVLVIRYENGTSEIISAFVDSGQTNFQMIEQTNDTEQANIRTRESRFTGIDPDKFIFGINANIGGAFILGLSGSGPSINIELGKENWNGEVNLVFPIYGFGALVTINHFWHKRNGGAYLGGGIGYSFYNNTYNNDEGGYTAHSLTIGLNAGYKFVMKSGLYFRTGIFTGYDFGIYWNKGWTFPVYIKPDLAIGWTMR